MRSFYLLFVLLTGLGHPAAAQSTKPHSAALFPFVEQGRWGFIDSAGAVVIAPRFACVQGFFEGLAPVREGEGYGYIDATGQFVIPPAYDFASPFRQGMAVVYQDNVPQLIDHNGHLVSLPATYQHLQWQPGLDQGGVWVATLPSYKRQLLDMQGHLLSPFFFNRIEAPSNNRLLVESTEQPRNANGLLAFRPIGVLNIRGQFVIPYYRFRWISTFRGGLAAAALYQSDDDNKPEQQCIIDTTGRILAHLAPGQRFDLAEHSKFLDGTVTVRVTTRGTYPNDDAYPTAVDRTGRPLFRNPEFNHLSAFYHGRAWVQEDDNWYLINKQGERLIKTPIEETLRPENAHEAPLFTGGVEPVALTDSVYAALDSLGRIVRQVTIALAYGERPQRQGNIMTFSAADSAQRLGFWNWHTGLLVPPRFSAISAAGYEHGLLAVEEDHRLGYLAPDGHYVWRAAPAASAPLNLDYMRRTFYQVASAVQLPHYAGFGGWAKSDNVPTRPTSSLLPANKLTLHVAPTAVSDGFASRIDGYRVSIANTTADTLVFDAQDSSLYLTVQAQDAHGQWRDIEYTPSSWCGNSYHQVYLAPGQGWQLMVPAYAGGLKTQLRLCLIRHKDDNPHKSNVLYSNSFPGSVNAAQFWRQEGHVAHDIMDSYSN